MPPTVRRATPADAPVIARYNAFLASESEGKTLDPAILAAGVAAGLVDPNKALYFLAEEGGESLGQLMLTREWSDWRNGWIWWIQSVYVRDDARRRGVFRTLFEHVHQAARADPEVIGLRLYVERENTGAQQTYGRMGMKRTGYLVYELCPLEVGKPGA
jgi:GNAT superfamily N-acetyltransferase